MNNSSIKIEQFMNVSHVKDKKGRFLSVQSRYASCFIITLNGRIRFTFEDQTVITDCNQGIFIPEGVSYKNECLESAESILINFFTSDPTAVPRVLNGMDEKLAMGFYREISEKAYENTESAQYYLFSKLYQLASLLFQTDPPKSNKERMAEKALSYMQHECERSDLQIDEVAAFCNVSAVYLRKVINEIYQKAPFRLLTDLRMKKAYEMLLEKRPIKEIALSVGYSDVYQFSRAYKRHFGHAPTIISAPSDN
ncbi:MAG: helix-turn-helix transcriptional regulator [Clostridia bacterium]|nr:helix-turn-helix transcriptional regulator [Clostridia bacterium]